MFYPVGLRGFLAIVSIKDSLDIVLPIISGSERYFPRGGGRYRDFVSAGAGVFFGCFLLFLAVLSFVFFALFREVFKIRTFFCCPKVFSSTHSPIVCIIL